MSQDKIAGYTGNRIFTLILTAYLLAMVLGDTFIQANNLPKAGKAYITTEQKRNK